MTGIYDSLRQEDEASWAKFIEASYAHLGHGTDGQGSPITRIVLEYSNEKYRKVHQQLFGETPEEASG